MRLNMTVLTVLLGFSLSGCGALSVLQGEPNRDVYELLLQNDTPLRCGRGRIADLVVETPKTRSTLDSDRIMVRPSTLQVAYLPDARWGDTVPTTLQTLLIRSFSRYDIFSHVGSAPLGLSADYALISTINDFNADAYGEAPQVRLSVDAQMVRESDARVVARGRFEASRTAPSTKAPDLASAFDLAAQDLVGQMTGWGLGALGVAKTSCTPVSGQR
ncbi:ABC-type transport auxiliary lipoprotein family protein [Tropicimonas sp. IMCC34043]|uniref:ABC-type transport auxiliary lipoprotein family protein n=1 Tax=Tropicimonas sp. IMCC34043 TaxID=2248760 RepID=UPI001E30DB36|nr:ABC-type transport auxiliary lipoprotein family protein [Tropicimonas sp. IMCC34043]